MQYKGREKAAKVVEFMSVYGIDCRNKESTKFYREFVGVIFAKCDGISWQ